MLTVLPEPSELKLRDPQDDLVNLQSSENLSTSCHIDLSAFNSNSLPTLLTQENKTIGQIFVKDNVVVCRFNEEAPKLDFIGFPDGVQVVIDAVNDVSIFQEGNNAPSVLIVSAKNIDINKSPHVSQGVLLKAQEQVVANSEMLSPEIEIEAKSINLREHLITNTLRVNAEDQLEIDADLEISSDFSFVSKQAKINGTICADKIQGKSDHLVNHASIEASDALLLNATKLETDGKLIAKNDLSIDSEHFNSSTRSILSAGGAAIFQGGSFELHGSLDFSNRFFCVANKLDLSTALSELDEVYIRCNDFVVQAGGVFKFNNSEINETQKLRNIKVDHFEVDKDASAAIDHVTLNTKQFCSQGSLTFNACDMECKTLDIQGHYSCKDSQLYASTKATLSGNHQSTLENSKLETDFLILSGQASMDKATLLTDRLLFDENSSIVLTQSEIESEGLIKLHKSAQCAAKNTNLTSGNYMLLTGIADFQKCTLHALSCKTSQRSHIKDSKIIASELWRDKGACIEHCEVLSTTAELLNKTSIAQTKIETNDLNHTGTGEIEKSHVTVHDLFYTYDNDLIFKDTKLITQQSFQQGSIRVTDGSDYQSSYMHQASGKLTVNDSISRCDGLMYTSKDAKLSEKNNAKVFSDSGLFYGNTKSRDSELATVGPLSFCGKTLGVNAVINCGSTMSFSGGEHAFTASNIQAKESVLINSNVTLQDESEMHGASCSQMGSLTLKGLSKLDVQDLSILGHFLATGYSKVKVDEKLQAYYGSETNLNLGSVQAKTMSFAGKLNAERSVLHALGDMAFESCSKSELRVIDLEAGEKLTFEHNASVTGAKVKTKAKALENDTKINIRDLEIAVEILRNSGEFEGDDSSLKIKASQAVLNTGRIHADKISLQTLALFNGFGGQIASDHDTKIQALLIANMLGDISSSGSLSMDSIVNFNLAGLYRGYDVNLRSAYSFNYGLVLPSLPNSWSDVFTVSRAVSMGRMLLTQSLPGYSNLISLGAMAVPYVGKAASGLYHHFNEGNGISDLPSAIYNSAYSLASSYISNIKGSISKLQSFDASDLLPMFMDGMSTYLSASQLVKSVTGAYSELSAQKDSKTPELSNSGNEEKSSADESNKSDDSHSPSSDQLEKPNTNQADYSSILDTVGGVAIQALGPSMNLQSVHGVNAGLIAGVNVTDSSWDDDNYGVKTGWNFSGNYTAGRNRGILSGMNFTATGEQYDNFGDMFGGNSMQLLFRDRFKNHQSAVLEGNHASVSGGEFSNAGKTNLNDGKMTVDRFEQTQTGQLSLKDIKVSVKNDAVLAGQKNFNSASLNAKNVTLSDQSEMKSSVIHAEEKLNQTGSLRGEESCFFGADVDLDGSNLTGGEVVAKNQLHIQHSETTQTRLCAKDADLKDSVFRGKMQEQENASTDDPKTQDQTAEKHDENGPQNASDKQETKNKPKNSSDEKQSQKQSEKSQNESDLKIDGQLKTERVVMQNMQVEANDMHLQRSTFQQSNVKAKGDLKADGLTTSGANFSAQNASIDGETHMSNTSVDARENIHLTA